MSVANVGIHLMGLYRWYYGPYWLTVFLDRECRILGDICSVREEVCEIAVAKHSLVGWKLENDVAPPLGVVQFLSRKHLHAAAEKSRLSAWIADRFRMVPVDGLWLGFAEPMTGDWVEAMEADDARRVKQCLEEEKKDAAITVADIERRVHAVLALIEDRRLGEALAAATRFVEEAPRWVQAACVEGQAYEALGLRAQAQGLVLTPSQTPRDGPLLDPVRLVPRNPQQFARLRRGTSQHNIYGESLEERRKAPSWLRPRDLHRLRPVLRTVHPGHVSYHERLELARVQMPPPSALRAVHVHRAPTLGTTPQFSSIQSHLNLNRLGTRVQAHRRHMPRSRLAENLLVELRVFHPPQSTSTNGISYAKPGSAF
jgi:hypothetical protein